MEPKMEGKAQETHKKFSITGVGISAHGTNLALGVCVFLLMRQFSITGVGISAHGAKNGRKSTRLTILTPDRKSVV